MNDPLDPQVGDRFWNAAGTRSILITARGTQNVLGIEDGTTDEIRLSLSVIANLLPFDPPVIAVDTTVYEFRMGGGERGLWTNAASPANTGRTLVLHPDGTFEENGT